MSPKNICTQQQTLLCVYLGWKLEQFRYENMRTSDCEFTWFLYQCVSEMFIFGSASDAFARNKCARKEDRREMSPWDPYNTPNTSPLSFCHTWHNTQNLWGSSLARRGTSILAWQVYPQAQVWKHTLITHPQLKLPAAFVCSCEVWPSHNADCNVSPIKLSTSNGPPGSHISSSYALSWADPSTRGSSRQYMNLQQRMSQKAKIQSQWSQKW